MAANPYASQRSPGTPLVRRRVNRCRTWLAVATIVFFVAPAALAGGGIAYASWCIFDRIPFRSVEEANQWNQQVTQGLSIWKFCASAAMVMLIATQSLCIFPIITVMMPLYGRLVLHLGADQVGLLMGASAVGSVVGSLFLIGLPRDKRVPLMMINALAVTGAILGMSRAPSFYIATALMIVNSLGLATNFGLCSTIVQERAPDYLRGRVSAVFMLSFVGIMPIAGLGVTGLSDLIGMPTALKIAALVYGAITLAVLARFRKQCCEPALSEEKPEETPAPPIAAAV